MMHEGTLSTVERLCEEVSDLVKQVRAEMKEAGYGTAPSSKASGALRRRSMDLTRALADLRR